MPLIAESKKSLLTNQFYETSWTAANGLLLTCLPEPAPLLVIRNILNVVLNRNWNSFFSPLSWRLLTKRFYAIHFSQLPLLTDHKRRFPLSERSAAQKVQLPIFSSFKLNLLLVSHLIRKKNCLKSKKIEMIRRINWEYEKRKCRGNFSGLYAMIISREFSPSSPRKTLFPPVTMPRFSANNNFYRRYNISSIATTQPIIVFHQLALSPLACLSLAELLFLKLIQLSPVTSSKYFCLTSNCGVNQSWVRIMRTISTSLLLYLVNLQNLRRLWMILINNLLMMIDLLGRLMDDLRRWWVMLLIDDVVLELRGGVRVGNYRVVAIAHWVVGAVFSRVVWWFIVGVTVRWIAVFASFKATIQRAVRQVEVNRRLVYRHLTNA